MSNASRNTIVSARECGKWLIKVMGANFSTTCFLWKTNVRRGWDRVCRGRGQRSKEMLRLLGFISCSCSRAGVHFLLFYGQQVSVSCNEAPPLCQQTLLLCVFIVQPFFVEYLPTRPATHLRMALSQNVHRARMVFVHHHSLCPTRYFSVPRQNERIGRYDFYRPSAARARSINRDLTGDVP